MRELGWDEEEDENANVQKSNGEKTRNMCGTNKEIQLRNISVIERNAYGMQKSARPSPPLFAVSNNIKDRWVTAAIIINTYIITTKCYQHKKSKCSNRTHKILITIVHINLVTLIANLMKIRNSIIKKYFTKRKKSLLLKEILSSKLLSPPFFLKATTSRTGETQLWIVINAITTINHILHHVVVVI